ncbi:hypothetical protein GSI_00313 [Ganoderma sinense ZZ0214-1]|uniref:TFIIS N-terminal domain-containing protein n=1 Tax=Ganoderma sinense ZZ0214-1 TaxID=1077348 RepID=A0A2G8SS98_9APHY|nr:hypothetical protein GSI_00313 [Ganoderma sinense ZZ0214-1]
MEYTNAAWLQAPIPDLQSVHDERTSTQEDWKEQAASVQGGLNDLLGDIQVQNAPSTSTNSPGPTFFTIPYHLLAATTPFNSAPFGASQWPAPTSQQVPVSSYSSLNGATSTSSHLQSQGQSSGSMVIDPALTTVNGSSASPPPQYQQTPFLSSQAQPRIQYPYQPQSNTSPLSINPAYVHANTSHFQQQQQQHALSLTSSHSHSPPQQQQGTLSPFVLHSPTSAFYAGIPPSSFYGQSVHSQPGPSSAGPSSTVHAQSQPPQPSQPLQPAPVSATPLLPVPNQLTAEQRRAQLLRDVKPLIQPTSFTGAGAVNQLVNILFDYGIAEVEASTRLEILTKIRDNAGNHYFRAWVDNNDALEIIREWLKLAFQGRSETQLLETIMPILHIIDRLPLTVEKLKIAKLGKLIMRLVKEPPTPAIKDMAANLEKKWRKLLAQEVSDKMDTENPEDKIKKRRAEGAPAKGAPPAKKAAISGMAAATPKAAAVKKEAKAVVKDAKSDSSFFSKPKPTKKEMPSFKKNVPPPVAPVKKEPDPNVAQPSSFNPFEEVLKSYASTGASATPPPSVPPPAAGPSTVVAAAAGPSGLTKKGKPRRSVTWAPEGKLEQIRLIERAVYDDDPALTPSMALHTQGSHPTHNIRDLDRDEGAALHAQTALFDEQIEWAEPQPLELPPEIQIPPRGNDSQERAAQEEREQNALLVLYTATTQIPDCPAEPSAQIGEDQVDEGVVTMLTGPEVDSVLWTATPPPDSQSAVADLVAQLAGGPGGEVLMGDGAQAAVSGLYTNGNGFNPEQLHQLMAQLQQTSPLLAPPPQAGHNDAGQGWNAGNQYSDYDRGYQENGAGHADTGISATLATKRSRIDR